MNYKDVLKSAGYPTDVLVLDFETFYDKDYSLSKMSIIEYIMDEKFEIMGLGMKRNDKPAEFLPCDISIPAWLPMNLDDYTVIVKNAKFDITILKEKLGIAPKYIIDVEDLSRNYDARMSHRLKDLAPMFKLKNKGDTKQFLGLHYNDMTPEQKTALEEYCLNDVDLEFELFKILLPLLTSPKVELALARSTLNLYLYPKIELNEAGAVSLIRKMNLEKYKTVSASGHAQKELSGNKSFVKLLKEALPDGELVPMKPGKNKNIPALAKDDEGLRYLLNHKDETVRNLVRARQAVKSWPLHTRRIVKLINQARASGGLLRIPLKYFGSHTGRWSGTEKINTQNLGAVGRAGKGTHELISRVRELLRAPAGQKLIIVDSAQIEAKVLAWLSGEASLIEDFANGEDIYSKFASRLFGCEVRKPRKGDGDSDAKILQIRRGFGKDAILGCGFGMGSKKFYDRCLQNYDLRPVFDSGEYDFTFIDGLIKTYRTTYKRIPEFWTLVEKCFKQVVKFPHTFSIAYCKPDGFNDAIIYELSELNIGRVYDLKFWNDKGTVNLQLPSGRVLYYRHCRIDNKGGIRWHHGNLWGGSITENIVQAAARDLLGHWILEFEEAGIPIVLHTHDEIVGIVPEEQSEEVFDGAMEIMESGPGWSEGLPLAAKGVVADVYKK